MLFSHRFLPIAASVLAALLLEIVYLKPSWIFFIGAISPLILFAAVCAVLGKQLITPWARLKFLIIPLLLTWSALAFALLVESSRARHFLALIVLLFLILFFESMSTYIWRHQEYVGYSLENLAGYALTLAVFLASSALIGFYVLLGWNIGFTALIFLAVIAAVNYIFFWISKTPHLETVLFSGVLTLVLAELFFAASVLPFHFMISGALLTVFWYGFSAISRAHLSGALMKKMLYRHFAFCGALIIILVAFGS